jgi:hypothetical protein
MGWDGEEFDIMLLLIFLAASMLKHSIHPQTALSSLRLGQTFSLGSRPVFAFHTSVVRPGAVLGRGLLTCDASNVCPV